MSNNKLFMVPTPTLPDPTRFPDLKFNARLA